jgi:amidase/nitrilase
MTLLRAALAVKGEELHCAVWPGWWSVGRHLGDKHAEPGSTRCDIEPAIREYAIENQAFVISTIGYLPPAEVPAEIRGEAGYNLAVGGSCVVGPSGVYLAEPVFGKETIVTATVEAEDRRLAKAYFDCLGHYSRFDVLTLGIRGEAWAPPGARRLVEGLTTTLRARLEEVAARYGIEPEQIVELAEQSLAAQRPGPPAAPSPPRRAKPRHS